ncbi:MAG TPA: hypothetical protein VH080_04990 [Gemmatimonadaceae bacterium]|jgi:hypothetical protein|nr:hypothetical protein [Gemmatimonadaceae bacterium]
MDDERLKELIDHVVRDAKVPTARERDELRRELESHFADAGGSPDALRAAIERFGSPELVGDALERAHRHNRVLTHVVRVLAASFAATLCALVIQIVMNLRFESRSSLSLAPSFVPSAAFSTMLVVALVAAWELDIDALCARLERHPVRLLGTLATLATSMVLFHAAQNGWVHPAKALTESSIDVVIWTCTIAILARADRVFSRVFTPIE